MYLQCVYLFLQKCQLLHWPGYSCIYNVLLALMLPFKLYLLKDPCQMHKKLSSLWQNSTPGNYHLLLQRASFQMLQGFWTSLQTRPNECVIIKFCVQILTYDSTLTCQRTNMTFISNILVFLGIQMSKVGSTASRR